VTSFSAAVSSLVFVPHSFVWDWSSSCKFSPDVLETCTSRSSTSFGSSVAGGLVGSERVAPSGVGTGEGWAGKLSGCEEGVTASEGLD
jgi:hypothetical protein